ncbi:MAG: cytochrome c biogenesis protein CcdA [Deltaproteobacteria bacterium]|nr:cytochrome c biogenesis protein CcdA [Deltaproteobacteria bacterium]
MRQPTLEFSDKGEASFLASFFIPPDHYLYKDKMEVLFPPDSPVQLVQIRFPESVMKEDPFLHKMLEIYRQSVTLEVVVRVSEGREIGVVKGLLRYQGCSRDFCYRQVEKSFELQFRGKNATPSTFFQKDLKTLIRQSKPLAGLFAFLGGIATDFTPCVLPLIPMTLAFIGIRKERKSRRNFVLTLALIGGMAFVYAVLGIIAAWVGQSLGFLFQSSLVLILFALLFLLMALSMFGLVHLQVPLFLRKRFAKMGGEGIGGALLAGATLGFLAAPCVGPVVGALLLYVAKTKDLPFGFLLLFLYGLGMGVPFLIIGSFWGSLSRGIHWGSFGNFLKKGLGVLLLLPALYYGWIAVESFKGAAPYPISHSDLPWKTTLAEGLEVAKREGKPVLIDFWATWCLPCLQMDKTIFQDEAVKKALESFVLVKIDCTQETPECRELVRRYEVIGWPTILFLNPNGELLKEFSFVGEVSSREVFLERLQKITD